MTRTRWAIVGLAIAVMAGAAALFLAQRFSVADSISVFSRDYMRADSEERESIAHAYLQTFSASELLTAIEGHSGTALCHVQGHPVGRAVYKQTGNFAESIRQCGNACTYGCFHGALMEMFKTESDSLGGAVEEESPEDFVAHVQQIAPDLCDRPEVASAVPYRFCTHGVGHMFAFIEQDNLEQAVRDCDVMNTALAVQACVTGVFMEHMFDPSNANDTETRSVAPCDRFPGNTEPCFRYKAYGWMRAWGGTVPALAACDTMGSDALICIRTIGEATSSAELRSTKAGFHAMCGSLTGEKFKACVIGVMLKLVDVNDGDDSDRMCDGVAAEYRDACLDVTRAYLAHSAQGMARTKQ